MHIPKPLKQALVALSAICILQSCSTGSNYSDSQQYDLHTLPIGIIGSDMSCIEKAEEIMSSDNFDNISGVPDGDEILDFAGEHFICLMDLAHDSYSSYIDSSRTSVIVESAIRDAAFLLNNDSTDIPKVKMLVIVSDTISEYCLVALEKMLKQDRKGVKVVTSAADCYEQLRSDNNLALRITPQESETYILRDSLTMFKYVPGEVPADSITISQISQ